jgi:aminoglycoside N3'-acetyltransferase
VLLAGCDNRANSMIHVAEEAMDAPYLNRTRTAHVLRRGEVTEVTVRRPGCSSGFNIVDHPLRAANQVRDATVGRSRLMLMRAADVVAVATEMLRRDWGALLCNKPDCDRCAWARQQISERSRSA